MCAMIFFFLCALHTTVLLHTEEQPFDKTATCTSNWSPWSFVVPAFLERPQVIEQPVCARKMLTFYRHRTCICDHQSTSTYIAKAGNGCIHRSLFPAHICTVLTRDPLFGIENASVRLRIKSVTQTSNSDELYRITYVPRRLSASTELSNRSRSKQFDSATEKTSEVEVKTLHRDQFDIWSWTIGTVMLLISVSCAVYLTCISI
ncbi:hypothetical protein CSKR_202785 [Clonorchis sinensis]|uniref:Uncharacterized protein n=1 Tax=Clonorchis sinensis TaxID=79923 RepID=A0A8T1M3I3_CLOSI|nr:hypothetical protein CSKR_202785 [Clonorchis sinensis]